MNDLIARIKAENWYMRLEHVPNNHMFFCELVAVKEEKTKITFGQANSLEAAIIDAIRKMDR